MKQSPSNQQGQHVVTILSGGLDSTALAYYLDHHGYNQTFVSFDYGQKHRRELDFAEATANRLGGAWHKIRLPLGDVLESALTTSSIEVPHGHYEEESMSRTVVPNRNAIMLAIAFGIANSLGADYVAIGVHAGDHAVYPDCRPEFIHRFEQMQRVALEGVNNGSPSLLAPFVHLRKDGIVQIGHGIQTPWALTWSCYEGGETHCGKCGTCVERKEAFLLAGVKDPTIYESEID